MDAIEDIESINNDIEVIEEPVIFINNESDFIPNCTNKQINDGEFIYKIQNKLGFGQFGNVYNCTTPLGRHIAIKIIDKSRLKLSDDLDNIQNEIIIHNNLKHKNILNFEKVYQSWSQIFILLELCKNDISRIYKTDICTELFSKFIISSVVEALMYIHEKLIVHRDIKLENIFIDENNNVKLGDFGLAKQLIEPDELLFSQVGTLEYFSPEMINNTGYSLNTDIWSLGVLFYELLFKITPFEAEGIRAIYRKITQCKYKIPKLPLIDNNSLNIIKGALTVNREERITLSNILFELTNN